jgi:hypothetical protein
MPSGFADITPRRLVLWGAALMLCYLPPLILRAENPVALFLVANAASVIVLGILLFLLRRGGTWRSPERGFLPVVLVWAVVFRLVLVWGDPVASDDIYRYLWDGRVAASGVNPYRLAPADGELAHLHTPELPARVTFPEMRTIYPPLAQGLFWLSHLLFGPSATGLKLLLVLCDVGLLAVMLRILRRTHIPDTALIAYAWCPLPILYGALDGHLDLPGILLLMGAILAAVGGRAWRSGVLLGLAGLTRVFPLLAMPLLAGSPRVRDVLVPAAVAGAVFVLGSLPFLEPTGGLTDSFLVFSSTWEFNGALFPLLKSLMGSNMAARSVCAGALAIWVAWLAFSRLDVVQKTLLAFCGFFLVMPTVHPWYLTMLAPFLSLRWSGAVAWLLAASGLANLTVLEFRAGGGWVQYPWVQVAQHVPFVLLLVHEARRRQGAFAPSGAAA